IWVFTQAFVARREVGVLCLIVDTDAVVRVIDRERPKLLGWRIWWDGELVSFAAIKPLIVFVLVSPKIGLPDAGGRSDHALRRGQGLVEIVGTLVGFAIVLLLLVRIKHDYVGPLGARPVIGIFETLGIGNIYRHQFADKRTLSEIEA